MKRNIVFTQNVYCTTRARMGDPKQTGKEQKYFGSHIQDDKFELVKGTVKSISEGLIKRIQRLNLRIDGVLIVIGDNLKDGDPIVDNWILNDSSSKVYTEAVAIFLSIILYAASPKMDGISSSGIVDVETDADIRKFCKEALKVDSLPPKDATALGVDLNPLVHWMSRPKKRILMEMQAAYMNTIRRMMGSWWRLWKKLFECQGFKSLAEPLLDVKKLLIDMCKILKRFFFLYDQFIPVFSNISKLSDSLVTEKYTVDKDEAAQKGSGDKESGNPNIPPENKSILDRSARLKGSMKDSIKDENIPPSQDHMQSSQGQRKYFADVVFTWLQSMSSSTDANILYLYYEFFFLGISSPSDDTDRKLLSFRYKEWVYDILKAMNKDVPWSRQYSMGFNTFQQFDKFKDESVKMELDKIAFNHLDLLNVPENDTLLKEFITQLKNKNNQEGGIDDNERMLMYDLLSITRMKHDTEKQEALFVVFRRKMKSYTKRNKSPEKVLELNITQPVKNVESNATGKGAVNASDPSGMLKRPQANREGPGEWILASSRKSAPRTSDKEYDLDTLHNFVLDFEESSSSAHKENKTMGAKGGNVRFEKQMEEMVQVYNMSDEQKKMLKISKWRRANIPKIAQHRLKDEVDAIYRKLDSEQQITYDEWVKLMNVSSNFEIAQLYTYFKFKFGSVHYQYHFEEAKDMFSNINWASEIFFRELQFWKEISLFLNVDKMPQKYRRKIEFCLDRIKGLSSRSNSPFHQFIRGISQTLLIICLLKTFESKRPLTSEEGTFLEDCIKRKLKEWLIDFDIGEMPESGNAGTSKRKHEELINKERLKTGKFKSKRKHGEYPKTERLKTGKFKRVRLKNQIYSPSFVLGTPYQSCYYYPHQYAYYQPIHYYPYAYYHPYPMYRFQTR